MSEETDGICILSLDSGGPGSYSQLLILKEKMSCLASDLKMAEEDVYPADYFDLMGGVGFGGLAAVMLGLLRMNITEAIKTYLSVTSTVFSEISLEKIDRDANTKRLRESIEAVLQSQNILPDAKMNKGPLDQRKCKVVLYASDSARVDHSQAFRTYSSRGASLNPTIIDAVCATMSLPSYFQPVKIGPPRRQQSFVGGVLGANNPTQLLLKEACNIYGQDRRIAQIMSIGCGIARPQAPNSRHEPDAGKMLREMIGDCEVVANELSTWLWNVDGYLRLNVTMDMETMKTKDWNNLCGIESQTSIHLARSEISEALGTALGHLRERIGTATLGQLNYSSGIKTTAKTPPAVSPHFVLREQPWKKMVDYLVTTPTSQQRIFAITGMGGCGKTQLVSYFLRQYPNLYAQTIYVDASSAPSIKFDLQAWARTLGDGHDDDVWEDAIRALNSVPSREQWILILDNADDPGLSLNQFLPRDIHLTILITSRNRNIGDHAPRSHLELKEMTPEEALAALRQAAQRKLPMDNQELHSAKTLIGELGRLAIALVHAGAYCRQMSSTVGGVSQPYTFTQYLSLFRSHRVDLLNRSEPFSLDNYQRGVYTTLDLSYEALPPECQEFLHFLSSFHYIDIPLAAFAEAAKKGFEDQEQYLPRDDVHKTIISKLKDLLHKEKQWNEMHLQGIIRTLRSFSLITASSMNDSLFLQLHPLVQAWSRDMNSVITQAYREMTVQVLTACGSGNFELNRFLLPHMIDILGQVQVQNMHINDLMAFGVVASQQGHFHKAGELFEVALGLIRHPKQASVRNTLEVMSWLASTYNNQGRWTESEELNVEVLEQRRLILGTEHPDTISAAAKLAWTYRNQGKWAESEKLLVKVLEQRRRILGIEHPDTLKAAVNLASTYHNQGRWAESEKLLVKVLEQQRRISGIEHPDTLRAAANLASTYRNQGRWAEAETLEVEVLEQKRRILGIEHPDTIEAAANLGTTYRFQGRWTESETLLLEVLEQRGRILGTEHPATIRAAGNLASTYRNQGKWAESETLLLEVLEQRGRILGTEHPATIRAAGNLASTYRNQGRWAEAEKLEVEVLEQRRRILGVEHPDTLTAAANLASTYHSQGLWTKSEKLEVEVLEQRKRVVGTEHPDTINAASNLAATYGAQGRWGEAATLHASAVQASLKVVGLQHPNTQTYINSLTLAYEKLGKTRNAQETKALSITDTPFHSTSLSPHDGSQPSVWKQWRERFFARLKPGDKRTT